MKISMDKQYKTRQGRPVKLLCIDRNHPKPVVGLVGESDELVCWSESGKYYLLPGGDSWDLVEVPQTTRVVRYMVITQKESHLAGVHSFNTRKQADSFQEAAIKWENYRTARYDFDIEVELK